MLPKDYKVPEVDGNYMRFKEGDNQFRLLCEPIMGWELWIEKKPRRFKPDEEMPIELAESADISPFTGLPKQPQYFWAMVVWNRDASPKPKIQILQMTQRTVQKGITKLDNSKAWGSPVGNGGYDIIVNRDDSGERTEYTTNPAPKEELDPKIMKEFKKANINLEALYEGKDPFSSEESNATVDALKEAFDIE